MSRIHISGHIGGVSFSGGHAGHFAGHHFSHHGFHFGHLFQQHHGRGFEAFMSLCGLASVLQGVSGASQPGSMPVNAPQASAMAAPNAALAATQAPAAKEFLADRQRELEENPEPMIAQFRAYNARNPKAQALSDSEITQLHRDAISEKQETFTELETQSQRGTGITADGAQQAIPAAQRTELNLATRELGLDTPEQRVPTRSRTL